MTRSRLTRLLVLLAFLLALLPGAPATALSLTPPQAVADDGHILIAESDLTTVVKRPTTDGEYVAWVRGAESPATSCHTLFVAPIRYLANRWSTGIQRGSPFAISNDVVIWAGAVRECRQYVYDADPGIYGAHLVSGQQYTITTDSIIDLELWQGTVVWITKEGSQSRSSVRMRDLDGGDPIDIARTGEQMLAFQLRYHGDRVFWLETPEDRSSFQVMSVQPGQPSLVLHTAAEIDWFDVTGNHLIWLSDTVLMIKNLTDGSTTTLSSDVAGAVSSDDRYVIWEQNPSLRNSTLRAYDLETGSWFTIVNSIADESGTLGVMNSSISRGVVVWDRWSTVDYRTKICAAYLEDVLPTAPRPDPGTTDPHWTYYLETGHYLAWGFGDYWETNGGLPVFGYPVTEEFTERNSDTGGDYTVQYVERQRFEYHPENTGTPYDVLLGRLGAELLERQGRDWRAFPAGDPAAAHYLPETGHAVAPEFWDFWSSRGLDLHDSDVSFRESLALFGYPLSEPMLETNADGDTVLTQYFERAVFEYHPENEGTDFVVLLRRLGVETLHARGWR